MNQPISQLGQGVSAAPAQTSLPITLPSYVMIRTRPPGHAKDRVGAKANGADNAPIANKRFMKILPVN
jgi:hypothetical protein